MGIVFRQSVKASFVTFTGAALGALSIYLGARYIHKQELGFVRNTLPEQAILVAQIFSLGLLSTMMVYVHKYPAGDKRRNLLLALNLVVPFLLTLIGLPFYFVFKRSIVSTYQPDDQPLVAQFYGLLPVLSLFFVLLIFFEQYLISQMKVAAATFMREVVLRLLTIGLILLFALHVIDYGMLVYGSVLVFAIPVAVLMVMSLKTKGFALSRDWRAFNSSERKELASFTWYHFLLSISVNFMGKLDIILLAVWSSLEDAAVYGIAVYIISFLQVPFRAMLNASFPILTKAVHDEDTEKVRDVYLRSSLNILIASIGLTVVICCNLGNAVAMLRKGFEAVSAIVLILTAGKLFDYSTGMNDQMLSITNYYKFNFRISVLMVALLLLLNYWLIPKYAYYGAAIATSVTLIIFNVSKLIFLKIKLNLQPYSRNSLLVFVAGGGAALAGYFFPFVMHPIIDAGIRSIVILLVYLALLILLKPSKDLNSYLASIRQNKRLF